MIEAQQNARSLDAAMDERPLTRLQWSVVVFCALVAGFDGFDIQAIAYTAPAIGKEWGIPSENFGLIFSIGVVGMIAGLLVQGQFADKVGRRPMILASVAIFGSATLATAFAGTISELVVARFIGGLGMGAALPNVIALTGEYAPLRLRTRLIVLMNAGLPLGGFLGGIASSFLIAEFGWRSVFVVGGAGPLLLGVLLFFFLPESPPFVAMNDKKRSSPRLPIIIRKLGLDPANVSVPVPEPSAKSKLLLASLFTEGRAVRTIQLSALFFANLMLFYFLIGWLPTLLTRAGLPLSQAVLVTAGLNLGSVVGGFLLGWIADKRGAGRTLAGTYCLTFLLLCLLGVYSDWGFIALAMIGGLLGLCIGGAQLVLNAFAAQVYPTDIRSAGVGLVNTSGRLGAVLGPVFGGLLLGYGVSINGLYLFLLIPTVIAGVAAFQMRKGSVETH